jgi:hypothetical protein
MTRNEHPSHPQVDSTLLEEVAASVTLREGAPGVAAFLRAVARQDGAPLKALARRLGWPVPVAAAVRRELETRGYLARRGGVWLTELGRSYVSDMLDYSASAAAFCPACNGHGLQDPAPELVRALQRLLERAPGVRVELDQAPCTAETALRRAALMHDRGALEGRDVLLLGDDDSLSLAIPLYLAHQGRNRAVDNITVLELDPGRIAFLDQTCAEIGAGVTVVPHDLRDPLPQALRGRFDCFQTDPPYTVAGAALFLTRAAEALRPGPGSLGFLSYGQPATADQFALFREVHRLGFAVRAVHRDFNAYHGASILGSTGQMIELEGLFAQPPYQAGRFTGGIYTAERTARRRGYRCAVCRRKLVLGEAGVARTIEALKAAGCPACGGRVFTRWSPDAGP